MSDVVHVHGSASAARRPALAPRRTDGHLVASITKRLGDLVAGTILIVLATPLILLLAALVRWDSPGPAFYRQTRVGHEGRSFRIIKLRTMRVDAEGHQTHAWAEGLAHGLANKCRDDARVTAVGSFLRRWSLDELPQIVNVLRGDMSIVGPRPLQPLEVATLTRDQQRRHTMRPGMTGLWQVSGRNLTSWEERMRLDLEYVESWTMRGDLEILTKTISAVLRRDGAF